MGARVHGREPSYPSLGVMPQRDDVDQAMSLLKHLDFYLTNQEA